MSRQRTITPLRSRTRIPAQLLNGNKHQFTEIDASKIPVKEINAEKSSPESGGQKGSTKTISFINLKGGVAKTTTTVGVATMLAGEFGKKVLVIDLDPQTNCTVMLIGQTQWEKLDKAKATLYTLFRDVIYQDSDFNIDLTLQKDVSGIAQVKNLDLIPSSLKLIDLQDKIALGSFVGPNQIIEKSIKNIKNNYDYILIDCPPNLGLVTLNGLRISDGYIIPTIPDVLSTYGIPSIVNRVAKFGNAIEREIKCLGIVATKVKQNALYTVKLEELKQEKFAPVPLFHTEFKDTVDLSLAAEFKYCNTLKMKWKSGYGFFKSFTCEIMKKMGD